MSLDTPSDFDSSLNVELDIDPLPMRHSTYYSDEPARIFLVDYMLFKVPVQLLRLNSEFFNTLLDIPSGEGSTGEGMTDIEPIRIAEESANTFADVLAWLYRQPLPSHGFFPRNESGSTGRWIKLLRFAHKFQMSTLHKAAQETLSSCKLEDLQKLALCDKYDVPLTWALDACRNICVREKPLTVPEIDLITKGTFCVLVYLRDTYKSLEQQEKDKTCRHGYSRRGSCGYVECTARLIDTLEDTKLQQWIEEAQGLRKNTEKRCKT